MGKFAGDEQLKALDRELEREHGLPADPVAERVVRWRMFRRPGPALEFARHIMLEDGDRLLAGRTRDSIGALYWVAVQVADLSRWGHRDAIQMTDAVDPQNPKSPML